MKLSLTPEAAKKLLRRLEHDADPDMRDAVAKIEQALQPGMMLGSDELKVVLRQLHAVGLPAGTDLDLIARAIPKLELMLNKTLIREGIGSGGAPAAGAAVKMKVHKLALKVNRRNEKGLTAKRR